MENMILIYSCMFSSIFPSISLIMVSSGNERFCLDCIMGKFSECLYLKFFPHSTNFFALPSFKHANFFSFCLSCYLSSHFFYCDGNFVLCLLAAENLIGKGGYAEVYKGCLPDGQLVAIKQMNKGTTEEQTTGFLSEIGIIAHVNHRNTAKLIGFGVEGGTYLVLELSPLGSLGSLLRG